MYMEGLLNPGFNTYQDPLEQYICYKKDLLSIENLYSWIRSSEGSDFQWYCY